MQIKWSKYQNGRQTRLLVWFSDLLIIFPLQEWQHEETEIKTLTWKTILDLCSDQQIRRSKWILQTTIWSLPQSWFFPGWLFSSPHHSPTFPGISPRSPDIDWTTRGIQTGQRVLLSEHYATICSPSCACQLYLTVLRLCLFRDHRNYGSTSQVSHNFPDFS